MKKLFVVLIFLTCITLMAAELSVKTGSSIYVKTTVPEGKAGGGDFYNIKLVPADGDYSSFSYTEADGGVSLVFNKAGTFNLNLIVNHVMKTTCASAKAEEYSSTPLRIVVTK